MRPVLAAAAILSVLALGAPPAAANCTTDITALKSRIDRETNPAKKGAALAAYAAALKAERERNTANCLSAVSKGKTKLK